MTASPIKLFRRQFAALLLLFATLITSSVSAQALSAYRPVGEARIPNFVGASGLLLAPSAYVQRSNQMVAFVSQASHTTSGGALVGLGGRLELGADVQRRDSNGTQILGGAKLNLIPEQLLTPAVSVGILDAFGSGADPRSGYVVVSKYVIPYFVEALAGKQGLGLKLHAGYGNGLFNHHPFFGAEIISSGGVSAIGEVVNGRGNLGARYQRHDFAATVGWLDFKHASGSISYTIASR